MPSYQVINTATNETKTYDVPVLRPAGILPIPYVSQLGPGADKYSGDCGGACSTMILRGYNPASDMTPDKFMSQSGKGTHDFLSIADIQNGLARNGVQTDYRANMQSGDLFSYLVQQKPMVMLVNYGVLVNAGTTERKDFKGPHFFLAVGMDNKYVYVHDPYCTGINGEARPYPYQLVMDAWARGAEQGNPNNAGVMPRFGLNQAPPPPVNIGTSNSSGTGGVSGSSNTKPLYKVKVIHAGGWVNIRSGPGIGYADIGDVVTGETRDIFEERTETGSTNLWGRIGPGQWILVRSDTAVKV